MYLAALKTRAEWRSLGRKVKRYAKPWAWLANKNKTPLFDQKQLDETNV